MTVRRVRVWRSYSNRVMVSVDSAAPFVLDQNAQTAVAPRVVWNGVGRMTIYHTGIDGQVWYSTNNSIISLGAANSWSRWQTVQTTGGDIRTTQSVSVVHFSNHPGQLYMAWRGYGDDHRIWGSFFNGTAWQNPTRISNGDSDFAPTITWNGSRNRLFIFIAGLSDRQPYYAFQDYGQPWTDFTRLGVFTTELGSSPAAATLANGDMEIAFTGFDRYVYHGTWPRLLNFRGFSTTLGNIQTELAPYVIAVGSVAYLLMTARVTQQVWYKRGYQP
jgi:hypothetical protein